MRSRGRHRGRRGMYLIEMMAVVGLLSVALLLAARISHDALLMHRVAAERAGQVEQYSALVVAMRMDLENARRVRVQRSGELVIDTPLNVVRWSADASRVVRRDGEKETIYSIGRELTWRSEAGVVRIDGGGLGEIVLVGPRANGGA